MDIRERIRNLVVVLPVCFIAALVPIIVYMKKIPITGAAYLYWTGAKENFDFYSYYKAFFLVIFTMVCMALYIVAKRAKRINDEIPLVIFSPLLLYLGLVVLSAVLSKYTDIALFGFNDRYEGTVVLVSYCILSLITSLIVFESKFVEKILFAALLSSIFIAVLSLFQYYGMDLMQTEFGRRLILPPNAQDIADKLKFIFGKNIMYGTMYNPNYVGSYAALLVPASVMFYLSRMKTTWKVLSGLLFCGASFVLLIGSMSRAGLIGSLTAIVILLIFLIWKERKQWLWAAGALFYLVTITFVMDGASGGRVSGEFLRINPFYENQRIEQGVQLQYFKNIKSDGNTFEIETTNSLMRMIYKENKLSFTDENNKTLQVYINKAENKLNFSADKFKDYSMDADLKNKVFIFYIKENPIRFYYDANQGFKMVSSTGLVFSNAPVKTFGFQKRELFASGRGFVWSRTIPLLKDTLLLGHGADTYTMFFPQNDIAGKLNGLQRSDIVVDKPHNWYLQMSVNTGVLSMISMLVFLVLVLMYAIKAVIKARESTTLRSITIGLICSIIGYCVAAIFNDSVVSVAPVFWVFLGLCISSSYLLRKQEEGVQNV
ncbi:MAG: O-antigen ligase family protein [Ruminiclostridium sp.]|nr:O-antigen ligase family protein [Ruminiclostridium sp.]